MEKKYPSHVYRALHLFLISYLNFSEGEENKNISPRVGLCTNLSRYVSENRHSPDVLESLFEFILRDFGPTVDKHGKRPNMYPFGEEDYIKRREADTQHKCPNRIAWVRKIASEIEGAYILE